MEAQWIDTSSTASYPVWIRAYIVYHLSGMEYRYPTPNTFALQGAKMK